MTRAPVDEFAIREVLGVAMVRDLTVGESFGSVTLTEEKAAITITVPTYGGRLTPQQARRLARQLHRLARRVDARTLSTISSSTRAPEGDNLSGGDGG